MDYIQLIFDATTGKLLRKMSNSICPDGNPDEAQKGETSWIERDPTVIEQILANDVELQNGKLVFTPKAPPIAPSYRELRAAEYPPIGDQLDAIWKWLEPPVGTEAYDMKQKILAVKAKYPKPTV